MTEEHELGESQPEEEKEKEEAAKILLSLKKPQNVIFFFECKIILKIGNEI